jgi:WD40 repeat protein
VSIYIYILLSLVHYDPQKLPTGTIDTGHRANIFGVKFLPANEDIIVSGAMDALVKICSLSSNRCLKTYKSHSRRVKAVEVTSSEPFCFFSCGDDGCVRQFDCKL